MVAANKNTNQDSFVLRLVIGPYAIYPVIIILVTLLWVPYVLRTHDWEPIEVIAHIPYPF